MVIINECIFGFHTFFLLFCHLKRLFFVLSSKIFHVDRLKKDSLSGVVSWHGVGQEDGDGQHGHLGQPQHGLEPDHLVRNC